jgi:NAD(P)-dependent dehydrogenase (short-subunit alcohol dehydrogenase family)
VFLTGRHLDGVQALADEITAAGGRASAAEVDALNEVAVREHADRVVAAAGRIDVSFNAIGLGEAQGAALADITPEHFLRPVETALRSQFLTATTAVRHMRAAGSGVILALTAQAARVPYPSVGGFGVAGAAIEALCRQLAVEAGPGGVRVVCLRSAGSPDTPGVREVWQRHAAAAGASLPEWEDRMADKTLLKRLPLLAEIANAATLMASDHASSVTGAVLNVTCGELVD